MSSLLSTKGSLNKLVLGVLVENLEVNVSTVEILSLVSLSPGQGRSSVIDALSYLQESGIENERFTTLLKHLQEAETMEDQVILLMFEIRFILNKATLLGFINTLINSALKIEDRVALRKELQLLGLNDIVQVSARKRIKQD